MIRARSCSRLVPLTTRNRRHRLEHFRRQGCRRIRARSHRANLIDTPIADDGSALSRHATTLTRLISTSS